MISIARSLHTPPKPRFKPGDIVRHRRYGYRGVVVEADLRCRADDQWYQSNQTQPDRDQPWYHVLVNGTVSTTYAAQASLDADGKGEPVDHPLVAEFFSGFTGRRYRRNTRQWPGWQTRPA